MVSHCPRGVPFPLAPRLPPAAARELSPVPTAPHPSLPHPSPAHLRLRVLPGSALSHLSPGPRGPWAQGSFSRGPMCTDPTPAEQAGAAGVDTGHPQVGSPRELEASSCPADGLRSLSPIRGERVPVGAATGYPNRWAAGDSKHHESILSGSGPESRAPREQGCLPRPSPAMWTRNLHMTFV